MPVGFVLGLVSGLIVKIVLSWFNLKIEYITFLKGVGLLTVGRIFLGNLLIAWLLYYVPRKIKKKQVSALLIGTVGFVLGFFGATSGISVEDYLKRIPHIVLEIFAYVNAVLGKSLIVVIISLLIAAVCEYYLVLL